MMTKEQRAAYDKKYYAANRESRRDQMKVYGVAHREQRKACDAARPNERLANDHKKRAKKAGVKIGDPKAILAWLKGWRTEAAVACHYCRVIFSGTSMTVDHVIPMSAGGPHDLTNLVVCCKSCNSSKCDKLLEEWQKQN